MTRVTMFHIFICVSLLLTVTDVTQGELSLIPSGITLHKVILSWEEAYQRCQEEGNLLASPITMDAFKAMKNVIGDTDTLYYIGTKASSYGKFVSVEGVPLENMTAAAVNMFQQLDPWDGDCLAMGRDSIKVVPCSTRLPYMCYQKNMFILDKKGCGPQSDGYTYYSSTDKCLKVHKLVTSWENGFWRCSFDGGRLAIIENEQDQQNFMDLYKFQDVLLWVFIGLRDIDGKGNWRTVNGKPVEQLYNKWSNDQKPANPNKVCGTINQYGKLENLACSNARYFVCERKSSVYSLA